MTATPHVVHVGLHKTGSSWLQQCVFPHLAGFTYAQRDPVLAALVGDLLRAPDDRFLSASFRAALDAFAERGERVLISNEALAGGLWDPLEAIGRSPRRLAEVVPGAQIVLLTRSQPEMLRAVYAQYVNEGGTRSFERFLAGDVDGPAFDLAKLEYDRIVTLFHELFGADRVWVVPYERLRADRAWFLSELHAGLGAETRAVESRNVNVSLSPAGLATLRAYNRLFRASQFNPSPVRALPGGRKVRSILQSRVDPVWRAVLPAQADRASLRRARSVAERYAESNARLAELSGYALRELGYP